MRHEPPTRRATLRRSLPSWIWDNDKLQSWLEGSAGKRASYASSAFTILGTNALAALGKPTLPVFETALVDANHTNRYRIMDAIRLMSYDEGTNTCLPLLLQALTNDDRLVRTAAVRVLTRIAPEVLTNTTQQ
jgi:hypothetical protein